MSRLTFLETIRIENGKIWNLSYHQKRMNATREYFFKAYDFIELSKIIDPKTQCRTKCRILYGKDILDITYDEYKMRIVKSLQVIKCDSIEYNYKFSERNDLNELFERRGERDDILISKKGLITDTSIGNIALYDGKRWFTPAQPLLKGTQRQCLIDNQIILEKEIPEKAIFDYDEVCIFNAMIPFGEISFSINSGIFF